MTSAHVPPVRRKAAQPRLGTHVPRAKTAIIAWLPGPVNDPQSTLATGFGSVGSGTISSCVATVRAVALEHLPAVATADVELEASGSRAALSPAEATATPRHIAARKDAAIVPAPATPVSPPLT